MFEELIDDMVREHPRGPIWDDERDLLFAGSVDQLVHEVDELDLLWTCGHIGAALARTCQGSAEGRKHLKQSGQEQPELSPELLAASGVCLGASSMLLPDAVIEALQEWHGKLVRAIYWASDQLKHACAAALITGADLTLTHTMQEA